MSDLVTPDPELLALIDAACTGQATREQMHLLNERLRSEAAARQLYLRYARLHTDLHFTFRARRAHEVLGRQLGLDSGEECPDIRRPDELAAPAPAAAPASRRRWRFVARRRWLVAASLGAVAVLAWLIWGTSRPLAPSSFAVLARTAACQWGDSASPGLALADGQRLKAGRLILREGLAEIAFDNGPVLILDGPAELELLDRDRGCLHSGRVVARVPPEAVGFTLQTPNSQFVDLGTEFGVAVGAGGATRMNVFHGVVVATLKNGSTRRVVEGQAVQVDAQSGSDLRDDAYEPEKFVRTFPDPVTRGRDQKTPYNTSRFDCMHIVPAPVNVSIDGNLNDWDRSGMFVSRCNEPYANHYYVKGAMMYDARFLYIGAHVGDPAPLRNAIEPLPKVLPWEGGGLQVRLSTDPKLGWPLAAEHERPGVKDNIGHRPQDVNEQLVHLTLWYCRPRDEACLHVCYGMDYHGERLNPRGFHGAFRRDANGRGYTLEYAIPWALLNAGEALPRGGEQMAANWVLHWSDAGGRTWKGQLVELMNPPHRADRTFLFARSWGKAIYHRTGNLPGGTVRPTD